MRIKDGVSNIVSEMRALYDTVNGEKPYFMAETLLTAANILSARDNNKVNKYKKYPLILLIRPISGRSEVRGYGDAANVTIAFITKASTGSIVNDRSDSNFDDILYPLKDLFISVLMICLLLSLVFSM